MTAASFASFSLANGAISQWVALWMMFAIALVGINAAVWTAAVSSVFDNARGLALGITVSGGALAQIVAPLASYYLIHRFGWRDAYRLLGLGWGSICLALVLTCLFDAHARSGRLDRRTDDESETNPCDGLTLRQAAGSIDLWRITLATIITIAFGIGVIVYQVPVLIDAGAAPARAAVLASASGAAGIAGKLLTGYIMDRTTNRQVASLTLVAGGVGFCLLLLPDHSFALIVCAMLLIGYSTGAKIQLSSYLVSRYSGLRNYGVIFSFIVSLITSASAFGVFITGLIRDTTGSYSAALIMAMLGSGVSAVLIAKLRPYPNWDELDAGGTTNDRLNNSSTPV